MYFHPLFIYIVVPYTKTAIIMFDIIFVLVFGRLQASGTLNFPDRLYPIWKWALGAGMLYAAIGTMLEYAFSGSFSLVSFFTDYCLVIHLVLLVFQTAAAYLLKNCTESMYLLGAGYCFGIVVPLYCGLPFPIGQRLCTINFSDNHSIQ